MIRVNELGRRHGRLVVIRRACNTITGRAQWLCDCDCGTRTVVSGKNLRTGNTRSCGCLRVAQGKATGKRGLSRTHRHCTGGYEGRKSPTYGTWQGILQRCTNANRPEWMNYGGRGIGICERWRNSFEAFLADMGERPTGRTIHRINNDGNYEPGNCKWATYFEQNAVGNKRTGKHRGDGGWRTSGVSDLTTGTIPQTV